MPIFPRIRLWLKPVIALAFDDENLWSVSSPEGEIRRGDTGVALDQKTRRVLAAGDEARALVADTRFAGRVEVVRGLGEATVTNHDVAVARLRHELRACMGARLSLSPRVVVTAPMAETAKRALASVLVNAGARDVITLPRVMAAALGAGIRVEDERPVTVFVLDKAWAGVAVIAKSATVAGIEGAGGFAEIVVEKLARARAAGDLGAANVQEETARLRREGLAHDDEAGRWFFARLRERLWNELKALEPALRDLAQESPLWLAGSCASTPGLAALAGRVWGADSIIPPRPEETPILGARKVLGELDWVMKSPAPT